MLEVKHWEICKCLKELGEICNKKKQLSGIHTFLEEKKRY